MATIQASENLNEKNVYANLQDRKDRQKPKFKLGLLVVQLIIKEFLVKVMVQTGLLSFLQ